MTAPPATRLMERFPDARPNGRGWTVKCPAHEDHNPSLSISQVEDGHMLVHCHAGCSVESVLAAIDLTMHDLFASDGRPTCPTPEVSYVLERQSEELTSRRAYTIELRTDFNGFYPDRFVEVEDDAFLPSDEMESCQRLSQAAE